MQRINSLIQYVLNKYKAVFDEKNIKIEFEFSENDIAYGDMVRIEQVLTNYINNAINHIAGNRVIKISKEIKNDKIIVYVFKYRRLTYTKIYLHNEGLIVCS